MLRTLYYSLKPGQRRLARRLYYLPQDLFELLFKKRAKYVPPKGMVFTGGGDYEAIGAAFFKIFNEKGLVNSNSDILEVGSGLGRMCLPFTSFLNTGSYTGLEIVPSAVDWANKNIAIDFKNFTFIHAEVYNELYNTDAKVRASEYTFPFQTASFDFIFLTSVFTHMQKQDVLRYLKEISRVLKPGGSILITWFILDEQSKSALEANKSRMKFDFEHGDFRSSSNAVLESNIAFEYALVREFIDSADLEIREFIPGWWRGGNKTNSYQDITIITKNNAGLSI